MIQTAHSSRAISFGLCVFWALLCIVARPLPGQESSTGTVIVARGGADAVLIWDATPVVAALTSSKTPHQECMRRLESEAMNVLAGHAVSLPVARTISVRVVYKKLGSVSPEYGDATLAGLEALFILSARRTDIVQYGKDIGRAPGSGATIKAAKLTVTGDLP